MSELSPGLIETQKTPLPNIEILAGKINIPDDEVTGRLVENTAPAVEALIDYLDGEKSLEQVQYTAKKSRLGLSKELQTKALELAATAQVELNAWLEEFDLNLKEVGKDLNILIKKIAPDFSPEQSARVERGMLAFLSVPSLDKLMLSPAKGEGGENQINWVPWVPIVATGVIIAGIYAYTTIKKRKSQENPFGKTGHRQFLEIDKARKGVEEEVAKEEKEKIERIKKKFDEWWKRLPKISSKTTKKVLIFAAIVSLAAPAVLSSPWGANLLGRESLQEAASYEEAIQGTELEPLFGPEGLIKDERPALKVFESGNMKYLNFTDAWDINMIRFGALDPAFLFVESQRGWLEEKTGGSLPDSLYGAEKPEEKNEAYLEWLEIGRERNLYSLEEYQALKARLELPIEVWFKAMLEARETEGGDREKLEVFNREVQRLLEELRQNGWSSQ